MDYLKEMKRRRFLAEQVRRAQPGSTAAGLAEHELRQLDDRLRSNMPDGADLDLRSVLLGGGSFESRAIGASARGTIADKGFAEVFVGALATLVPLLNVSQTLTTTTSEDVAFSFVQTLPSAGDVVADGGTATSGDPTLGVAHTSATYKYMRTVVLAAEVALDSFLDVEGVLARMLVDVMHADVGDDLWGGDGSAAPQGLLAGPTATTAASASTLVIDDVANSLSNLGAQYLPTAAILLSNGAYWQLRRQTLGTSAAGGQAWPASAGMELFGLPVYVDGGLAAPSTGVKTACVGSFRHGYLVRMGPVQVAVDGGAHYDTDQLTLRVSFRSDGRRMNQSALRTIAMA